MIQKFNPALQDIVLFLSAVAVFSLSLGNGFVGDDLVYFVGNKTLIGFDLRRIIMSGALEVDYCPLRDISLAIDYRLWGENPFGFHLSNLILYGLSVVVLRHLFSKLQQRVVGQFVEQDLPANPAGPFLAALIFAVHPVHGEVVYAANHRGIILAGLFVILSSLCYLNHLGKETGRVGWYAAAFVSFIAAILSKEYSIILPLLLVCFAVWGDRKMLKRRLLGLLPFFIVSGIFYYVFKSIALSARFIAPSAGNIFSDLFSKLLVAIEIITYYLFRLLNAERVGALIQDNFQQPRLVLVICSLSVIAAIGSTVWVLRKRAPYLFVGFILYLVCLIPFLNVFKTYPIATDRFAYLPSIGLFFAFCAVSFRKRFVLGALVSIIVVLACSFLSLRQAVHWKDNLVFLEYISNREPSLNSYANLGMAYLNANQPQQARGAFLKALEHVSESPAGTSRGDILLMLGDNEGAIQAFESILAQYKDSPNFSYIVSWQLYSNLSKAYMNSGDYPSAIRAAESAIRLKPGNAGLQNSLGVLYGGAKQFDRAIKAFEAAMALDPEYGFAPLNLARTYLTLGDHGNARTYLRLVRARFPALRNEADLLEKNAR